MVRTPTDFEQTQINFLNVFNLQLWPPPYSESPFKTSIYGSNVDAWMAKRNCEGIWILHESRKNSNGKTKDQYRILSSTAPLGDITNAPTPSDNDVLAALVATIKHRGRRPTYSHSVIYRCQCWGPQRVVPRTTDSALRPSVKTGCTAAITFKYRFDEKVDVVYQWKHSGHDPYSRQGLSNAKIPRSLRLWVKDQAEKGISASQMAAIVRQVTRYCAMEMEQNHQLFPLAGLLSPKRINALISTIARNSYRRGKTWRESMINWAAHLISEGWQATFMEPPDMFTTDGKPLWMFFMISSFALKKVLPTSGGIIMIDSTHDTCVHDDGKGRSKPPLYTLMVRDMVTGAGCPVAWAIIPSQAEPPLTLFLKWFRTFHPIIPTAIMMDCSDTEALAVELAYNDIKPNIIYCVWHCVKNWRKQLRDKIKDVHAWPGSEKLTFEAKRNMLVNKMVSGLQLLLYTRSKDRFHELWRQWVLLFQPRYPQVVEYFKTWWIKRLIRWAMAWRQYAHDGVDTNNYIESYHSYLKNQFLRSNRAQAADFLVWVVSSDLDDHYQQKHESVKLGLTKRVLCKAELRSRDTARALGLDTLNNMINRDVQDELRFNIRSFNHSTTYYQVDCDAQGRLETCSCPHFKTSGQVCKHIFAVAIVTDGTPIAGVSNMINAQVTDPDDLEEDLAMLQQVADMETANVKSEVVELAGDVDKLIEDLKRVELGDQSLYKLDTVQSARGAVQQARFNIRDIYNPNDRFETQRSRGG